jgi:hypothetical protein
MIQYLNRPHVTLTLVNISISICGSVTLTLVNISISICGYVASFSQYYDMLLQVGWLLCS